MVTEWKDCPQDFETWLQVHREREGGAERVGAHWLLDVVIAVDAICFNNFFRLIPVFWMPEDAEKEKPNVCGRYGYGRIEIARWFHREQGLSDLLITLVFHELCHAYCDYQNIADTVDEYHTKEYKRVCEEHGGVCEYRDTVVGYNDTRLQTAYLERIKYKLRVRGCYEEAEEERNAS